MGENKSALPFSGWGQKGGGREEEGGFWEKHFSSDCLLVFRYCIVQCACRSEGHSRVQLTVRCGLIHLECFSIDQRSSS
jgi:hypothetical protein